MNTALRLSLRNKDQVEGTVDVQPTVALETAKPLGYDEFIASGAQTQPSVDRSPAQIQPLGDKPAGYDEYLAPELKEAKYGSTSQMLKAGAEGLAQGLGGPLAPAAEEAMGVNPEDIRGRAEENPITHYGSEITGLVLPAIVSAGGSLAAKAGMQTVAEALPKLAQFSQAGLLDSVVSKVLPAAGETLASKIGISAAKGFVENSLLAGSDEASKMVLQDPNQSAQTALTSIGLAGVLGAGLNAGLGAGSALWNAKVGGKAAQEVANFKSRIKAHIENPDPVTSMTGELDSYMKEMNKVGSETYGDTGVKSQAIEKLVPQMHEGMTTQVSELNDKLNDSLDKLSSKNDPNARLLEDKINSFKSKLTDDSKPHDIFNAMQDLKQSLQEDARYNEGISPLSERPYRSTVKNLANDVKESLEDRDVWGKASDVQSSINEAFTKYLKSTKDFRGLMTTDVMGERVVDPAKVNTYLNQLNKGGAEIKASKLKNFIESGEEFKNAVSRTYERIGEESPIQSVPLNTTYASMDKKTLGSKIADQFIDKGLTSAGGKGIGALIGGTIGHFAGHGELGALVGAHALGPFFSSVLPGIAKSLVGKEASGIGFRGAVDAAAAVYSGEALTSKAIKNLFRTEGEVLGSSYMPTERDRARLQKSLDAMQKNPQGFMNMAANHPAAHYLPDHANAMAEAASGAASYIQSLKPNVDPKSPLDHAPTPSKVEVAAYNNAMNIAQQPLVVLDRIKKGTITAKDITAIGSMYPSLYNRLKTKLQDEVTEQVSKGKVIPYKTRIGLSMFLAQPMDSTMSPMSIQASQSGQGSAQSNDQGQSQPQSKGTKSSPALQKMGSMYQTPAQAREAHRAKE